MRTQPEPKESFSSYGLTNHMVLTSGTRLLLQAPNQKQKRYFNDFLGEQKHDMSCLDACIHRLKRVSQARKKDEKYKLRNMGQGLWGEKLRGKRRENTEEEGTDLKALWPQIPPALRQHFDPFGLNYELETEKCNITSFNENVKILHTSVCNECLWTGNVVLLYCSPAAISKEFLLNRSTSENLSLSQIL